MCRECPQCMPDAPIVSQNLPESHIICQMLSESTRVYHSLLDSPRVSQLLTDSDQSLPESVCSSLFVYVCLCGGLHVSVSGSVCRSVCLSSRKVGVVVTGIVVTRVVGVEGVVGVAGVVGVVKSGHVPAPARVAQYCFF